MTYDLSTVPGAVRMPSRVPGPEEIRQITGAARKVVGEIAGMLEALSDTRIVVPRSEWTVGEQGAHLAFTNIGFGLFAMGLEYPYGDGTKGSLAEENETSLMGFSERGGPALAEQMKQATETFITMVEAAPPDRDCFSPLGRMPLGTLTSYFLVHNLMHGCAISSGLNHSFPFKPEHMPMVWPMVLNSFSGFVNKSACKGISGCVHLKVIGGFDSFFEMRNSELNVLDAPTGPVDCVVTAEPVHLFLTLIKMLSAAEGVELGELIVSGTDPGLFERIMNAVDVP